MNIIYSTKFGSHLYGTDLPTSDTDFKGIYIPTYKDIVLQRIVPVVSKSSNPTSSKNTKDDIDSEIFSLDKYMCLLLDGQSVALGMLFSVDPYIQQKSYIWDELYENRKHWLSKNVKPIIGYCRQQSSKYGIKGSRVAAIRKVLAALLELQERYKPSTKLIEVWDTFENLANTTEHCFITKEFMRSDQSKEYFMFECCNKKVQDHISLKEAIKIYQRSFDEYGHRALLAEKNESIDWKSLMHAVRVCHEGIELMNDQHITYHRPEKDLLLKIRKGEMDYKEVAEIIETKFDELEKASLVSSLPETPNYELADDFIFRVYSYRDI